MTREEIITALLCCVSYDDSDCKMCPLLTNTECLIALKTAVVDLIENQQRHIEALMKANDSLKDAIARRDKQIAVRCRECKYWGDEDGKFQDSDGALRARCTVHNYLLDGRHTGWCPTENDFCSYGERKGGVDDG